MNLSSPLQSRRTFVVRASTGTAAALLASQTLASRLSATPLAPEPAIPEDLLYTSAKRLARMIAEKKVSSVEVVTAYYKRIDEVNPKLNAVVQFCRERALAEAKFADEALAKGTIFGPLHGVPCTIKDSLETAGVVSTGGTLGRKNFIPSKDATVVARVRAAGAIVMGKTNTPELTLSGMTTNLIYGKTINPYKEGYQPGGSTGGGGSIIAAGGSPFDIGTDFGGSIRGPAHFNGITGIKPTTGRVPRTGHIVGYGGYFDSFQVVGPLARWVEDLELIMPIISGPDYSDAAILPMPWADPSAVDVKKLRVAYYINNGSVIEPTAETAAAVKRVLGALDQAGISYTEDCPKALIKESQELRNALSTADGRAWTKRMLKKYGTTEVSPVISLVDNPTAPSSAFTELAEQFDANRSKFLQWFQNYDIILTPVNRTPAEPWPTTLAPQAPTPGSYAHMGTFNNTGWPGTVVRAGTSPDGLPIGVQFIGRPWREDTTLAIAKLVEASLGGYSKPSL